MRYERLSDITRLAIRLQGLRGGMTIADIAREFDVSRRTAERLRSAVEQAFGPLDTVEGVGRQIRWRLQSPSLRQLVRVSSRELAELNLAAESLERNGLAERADALKELAVKLQAISQPRSREDLDADLEALMGAEGLAMRAGPRPRLQEGVLALLRDAIKTDRVVALHYFGQSSKKLSWQRVQPYGVLYGNRAFLVGKRRGAGRYGSGGWQTPARCESPIRPSSGIRTSTCGATRSSPSAPTKSGPCGWCCGSPPTWRGTPTPFCSIPTRQRRKTKTVR